MPSVVFDPVAFVARYPEFSGVSAQTLALYFTEATLYLDNSDASRVTDLGQRAALYNMLVAHIAALNGAGANGTGAPALVGRVSDASEGSVHASAEYAAPTSGTQAWYQQTQYGAAYWAATGTYRTMQYVPRQSGYPVWR